MISSTVLGTVLSLATGLALPASPAAAGSREIIVRFSAPPRAEQLRAVQAIAPEVRGWRGLRHVRVAKSGRVPHPLESVRLALLEDDADAVAIASRVQRLEGVRWANPNAEVRPCALPSGDFEPNDPLYGEQWAPQRIDAPRAWAMTRGDSHIVTAVLDYGIAFAHEEFQEDAIWRNPGEVPDNGIDDDGNGFVDDIVGWDFVSDDNWPEGNGRHGTAVAGVIGARLDNGRGIAGLANARIMPIRIATVGALVEGLYYVVDMGAHVVNMSVVASGPDLDELEGAVLYAEANGVTMVAGAGNDDESFPIYPAAYPTVIGVSATDRDDGRAEFSNHGPWIDLAAPGVDILTTWMSVEGEYHTVSGTSFSTPHVVGAAALVLSIDAGLPPAHLRGLLEATAEDLGDPGFDELFGHGRVNVGRAVEAAAHRLACPGDVERDGTVDMADVLVVLTSWGTSDWRADVDRDGVVAFGDMLVLLSGWGPCDGPP